MGSDDLFHKRKERGAASLRRKKARIAPYDRVLIVCEGSKTEPSYLREIRDAYRISTANIDICGEECGSDPLSVVKYAIKKFLKDRDYDRVYCVIDRDKHATFNAAMEKIDQAKLGKGIKFIAIVSVPCFEFWILLHYRYTTRQFLAAGSASNGDLVVAELDRNKIIPGYKKGMRNIFSLTRDKLQIAIENSKKLQKHNSDTGTDHPATNMHELIEYLINLNNQ